MFIAVSRGKNVGTMTMIESRLVEIVDRWTDNSDPASTDIDWLIANAKTLEAELKAERADIVDKARRLREATEHAYAQQDELKAAQGMIKRYQHELGEVTEIRDWNEKHCNTCPSCLNGGP